MRRGVVASFDPLLMCEGREGVVVVGWGDVEGMWGVGRLRFLRVEKGWDLRITVDSR